MSFVAGFVPPLTCLLPRSFLFAGSPLVACLFARGRGYWLCKLGERGCVSAEGASR